MRKREAMSEEHPGFDHQDALLAGGVLLSEAGAFAIWWPSALLLGAVYCFVAVYLIERRKRKMESRARN